MFVLTLRKLKYLRYFINSSCLTQIYKSANGLPVRHPIIAYVLLCEDQVECTACGISQMNQTSIETSNQRQLDLRKIEYLKY